jgi:hypothetical protein
MEEEIEENYLQFLREQQLKDLGSLTELPEDYEETKEYTKLPVIMSNLVKDQTCSYPG